MSVIHRHILRADDMGRTVKNRLTPLGDPSQPRIGRVAACTVKHQRSVAIRGAFILS
jgi:hypothetical protein